VDNMNLTYDSMRKDWITVLRIGKPYWASRKRNILSVPGMPGGHLASTDINPLVIPVRIEIQGDSESDYLDKVDEFVGWLDVNKPVPLVFDRYPYRTYYAVVDGNLDPDEIVSIGFVDVFFVCPDPFSYGPETPYIFPSDAVNLTNDGAADADPIFELEVLKPITFAMVQNHNEEYMMIGRPIDVNSKIVNTRTLLLEERGQTLNTWDATPTSVDGGVVAGSLSTDNDGITVPSYGPDTDNWHGPALLKEVTVAQDFEVEAMVQGRTTTTGQTFRIEVYLFDEGMNVLGKMAIMDNSLNVHRKKGEGRVGPYVGKNTNYLISSANYSYDQDYFYGMLRMRREGKRITFYVTRINNNNKHVQTLSKTFVDNANEYQGRLKYVQIHIGKYGSTERAYAPKIDSIKVFELDQATEDQTPYIAQTNDVITFDHVNDEILINGEDRKDLKDFGASYFQLSKGNNALVVHPDDSFEMTCRFRKRFR